MPLDPNICKKLLEVIKPSNIDSFNLTESKKKIWEQCRRDEQLEQYRLRNIAQQKINRYRNLQAQRQATLNELLEVTSKKERIKKCREKILPRLEKIPLLYRDPKANLLVHNCNKLLKLSNKPANDNSKKRRTSRNKKSKSKKKSRSKKSRSKKSRGHRK